MINTTLLLVFANYYSKLQLILTFGDCYNLKILRVSQFASNVCQDVLDEL